ncbi:glycosyltransferase family 2 protein [Phragmitibacter flavus]|uniref:Glycosyltransferase family 2 protein n=1 Tax=Phragmitibacter flavus TaxID=2576071 RepID=A0A5R8KLH4_9BACT|nr:glycosyltransferase family 2 protein [Phragmitibacter flavus]TLD72569.1 glycosyltransferase family 2 protein [Phragmitibacter flavus]
MAAASTHLFAFQVSPSHGATTIQPAHPLPNSTAWVFDHECRINGWFLPANSGTTHGLRAIQSGQTHVAQRKQLRPEVYFQYPDHPESLKSGFRLTLPLTLGRNQVTLQFKTESGQWENFCTLTLWLPPFPKLLQQFLPRQAQSGYETWCNTQDQIEQTRATEVLKTLPHWPEKPLISLLLPVYNTPEKWLRRAIESVTQQSYPHWELCIADDHSTAPHIRPLLESLAAREPRIKLTFRSENGHICHASNSALGLCTGSFTALLDHDDELPPHALLRVAEEILSHPDANLIFSDEDKIDTLGIRSDPFFKPGCNLELLLFENFICHLGVYRTSLIQNLGGFRPGFEGAQDWDLALRVVAAVPPNTIHHIPQILYHWRTLETSTAAQKDAKPYALEAGARAVRDHLQNTAPGATLAIDPNDHTLRVHWPLPSPTPKVSIIIPTRDRVDLLRVAIDTLVAKTSYEHYELIIVDHASDQPETFAYFDLLRRTLPALTILRVEGEFNWSRLNNLGAQSATGDLLLFLNNDVEITSSDWLHELVTNVSRPGIGAVGARLLYPNGTLQHAGVALRLHGMAGHPFAALKPEIRTIAGTPAAPREVTAVTGACLIVSRENFDLAHGFDEEQLPISYNDVDFCLRLRSHGLRNLYAANAVLLHHESASRHTLEKESVRKASATVEAQIILARWPKEFTQDAFYNPNLSLLTTLPTPTSEQSLSF